MGPGHTEFPRKEETVTTQELEQPQAIETKEASQIATDVLGLIEAGDEASAWQILNRLHPADIGSILVSLPRSSRDAMLHIMSPDTVVWILEHTSPLEGARVATRFGSRILTGALRQLHPVEAVSMLQRLHIPLGQTREVVQELEPPPQEMQLVTYSPGTAGAIMVSQFPTVGIDELTQTALDNLLELDRTRYKFTDVFVLGEDGQLAGQVNMVDLALAPVDTAVSSVASPIVATVDVDTPTSECARLRRHYNLTQLPVVQDGRLIAVIPAEALLSAVVREDTRLMLQVANVAGESIDGPLTSSIRTRLPWLTVNLGTTFLAAATIALFESTLAKVVVLAAFLPVVAGQGGIGGTQTLTLIVRSIALGQLLGEVALRLLIREALLGLLHGVWLGILVAGIAIIWKQSLGLGLVLGLAMLGNMIVAGTVGAAVPLFLRRIGVVPAVASAVVVTTFTDVFGFLLFLGIATAAINMIQ